MATKNDESAKAPRAGYDAALTIYTSAIEAMHTGDFGKARELFASIELQIGDEPELVERTRTYIRVCDQRLAPSSDEPADAEARYFAAVLKSNEGEFDEALRLIDQALAERPHLATYVYTRASIYALLGRVHESVSDLRQALASDPSIRFQAVNDPDFERIREEPAFIDVIEPTPAGS